MEKITIATTTDNISLTTGGAFSSAFTSGVTVTVADLDDANTFTYDGGLYSGDTTISVTSDAVADGAAEDVTVTSNSGADTVTLTFASWVGAGGDGGSIIVNTRAGDDTITVTQGDLAANTTSQAVTITGGTGADTITLSANDNGTGASAMSVLVIADGDSLVGSRDKITNYNLGDGTDQADILDFDTGAVGTLATSTDQGVILSHNIANGVATFDDAAAYAAELIINASNLSDTLDYIEANANTNGVVAFEYDSSGNGVNDATMVYHNGTENSLVELVGVTGATTVATTAVTANMIGIGA